jgi:hypothetical protein
VANPKTSLLPTKIERPDRPSPSQSPSNPASQASSHDPSALADDTDGGDGAIIEEQDEEQDDQVDQNQGSGQDQTLPPLPPQNGSGRGSFFAGGLDPEREAQPQTQAPAGAGEPSNHRPPNRTAKAPPPRSVFSCLCSPFSAFQDVDNSYDADPNASATAAT